MNLFVRVVSAACEKIIEQAIVNLCLCQYDQQGLNSYIGLARLRYIMVGLETVQHPYQTLGRQLWPDSVDDQQVVEALAFLFVSQVSPDQEDQVLNATR